MLLNKYWQFRCVLIYVLISIYEWLVKLLITFSLRSCLAAFSNISQICTSWPVLHETVGLHWIKKFKEQLHALRKNSLAVTSRTMEISVCTCASLSDCSWMGCLYFFTTFYQWDCLHCHKAQRCNKLCHRFYSSLHLSLLD